MFDVIYLIKFIVKSAFNDFFHCLNKRIVNGIVSKAGCAYESPTLRMHLPPEDLHLSVLQLALDPLVVLVV